MKLEITFDRGLSKADLDGKKITLKTAFLKKMYVGDLVEYIKQSK